jgi:hypothetical protein
VLVKVLATSVTSAQRDYCQDRFVPLLVTLISLMAGSVTNQPK